MASSDEEAGTYGTLPPAKPSSLPKLTPAEMQDLRDGQRVQKQERDGNTGTGLVVLEVDAPPSVVLDCLNRFEEYDSMIPVVRRAKVTKKTQSADGVLKVECDYRISKFWLGLSVLHHASQERCPGGIRGIVQFDLDKNTNSAVLREASGFWYVEPLPDGRRSRVWLQADLKASCLLPHWLIDYAAERALRRATAWMQPHVEKLWLEQQEKASLRQSTWASQDDDRPGFSSIPPTSPLQLSAAC